MSEEREAFEEWWYAKINAGRTPLDIAFSAHLEHVEVVKDRDALAARQSAGEPVYDKSIVKRIATQMGWTPPAGATVQEPVGYFYNCAAEGEKPHWLPVDERYKDRHGVVAFCAAPIGDNRAEIEIEQHRKMQERFAQRPQTPATADFDLPAPNDAVGDDGAKACPCLEWADAIQAKIKTKPLADESSQQAESKRVELTDDEIGALEKACGLLFGLGKYVEAQLVRALLARVQAKGE